MTWSQARACFPAVNGDINAIRLRFGSHRAKSGEPALLRTEPKETFLLWVFFCDWPWCDVVDSLPMFSTCSAMSQRSFLTTMFRGDWWPAAKADAVHEVTSVGLDFLTHWLAQSR